MPRIINYILLAIVCFLPLFNGGKGFGAFCAVNVLLFGLGLGVIYRLRKKDQVSLATVPQFNTWVSWFYIIVLLNLFFTVYLYATVIEWIRITGYILLYLLLSLNAGSDRKSFTSLIRQTLVLVIILSLIEAIIIIIQTLLHLVPRGTMPNENVAASYILIGLMCIVAYVFFDSESTRREKVMGRLVALVLTGALLLTHSRGILIALVAALGVLVKLKYKKWGLIAVFLAAVVILAFFPLSFFDAVFKINTPYSYRRIYIWQSAWEIIKNRPWFGWGMGNFGLAYPRFNMPGFDTVLRYGKVTRFAHNEFLQLAAELGLPALGLFLGIIRYVFKAGRDLAREKYFSWTQAAGFSALTGIIVHSLVDFNLHLPAVTFITVILGASLLFGSSASQDKACYVSAATKKVISLLMIAILAINTSFFIGHLFLTKAERGEATKAPLESVINAYQKAQWFNPLNSYHHEKLARIYTNQYQNDHNVSAGELAVSEYTLASRLNPEEASYYEDLFYLYYNLGSSLPDMETNYVLVNTHNPHLAKPTLVLAIFHLQRRNFGRAIQLLSEVINKEPNYLAAYYYLAKVYESLGDPEAARDQYEILVPKINQHLEKMAQSDYELQALKVPRLEVFTRLGILYSQERKHPQAVSMLKQALSLDPRQPEALNALAGAYFSQGKYQTALPYAREAVCLAPQNLEFKQNLDLCLQKISSSRKP
ncbi:MAG: O-antigen ligase family protein [Elusimicrobia bacterium]|nr:O-antigen ligase family protein [Elusimicrobiota bacterium]